MSLCLLIASCFVYELVEADPDWVLVAKGFIPRSEILTNSQALFTAIGILGMISARFCRCLGVDGKVNHCLQVPR